MKKSIALLLSLLLVVSALAAVTSCSQEKKAYTVGVCQLIQHTALDAATEGFKKALEDELGAQVNVIVKNASGDSNVCTTIVNGFVAQGVDLIMANATPALQAAAAATDTIPILGTSVTEYGTALDITDFKGTVGGNISGTSDLAPLDEQAQMVKDLFPSASKVGILYCSSEANSIYQVKMVTQYLKELGFTVTAYSFTDSNDVSSVTATACAANDVLYIPTDNVAASNTEAIANVALDAKTPIIAGEEGICKGCGVATLSINYYDLGYATGKMAAKILKGEAKISEMPIEYAPQVTKKYNKANCEALNVTIPEGYIEITD
ncbi:MAG: ABC transporter substrate-binding protein [Clostridia bacterium]|nr:ABC transporter substrate-binding protein [Clostridia bacterium]